MAFVIPTYPRLKRVTKQILTLACLASTLAIGLTSSMAYAKRPLTAVADLRYGAALYNYYQNKNLEALTELLVAKKKGGIQGHGDNPEIMEGGFRMAYGMETSAGEIFNRLLTANRPQRTRDAAWFHLAKMHYSHQNWSESESALAQMGGKTVADIAKEVKFLRFNLALRQERLEQAESLLDRHNPWQPYMHFNIASAYSAIGDYDKGISHYTKLLNMRQNSDEFLSLYDKAMTAAGYAYLLKEDYPAAAELFSRVRLASPFSSRALLGYGWAEAEQDQYLLALKPWVELSKHKLIDQNTQEVLIAIPYAYEQLDRRGLALSGFQSAEQTFLSEIHILDSVIQSIPDYAIRDALNIDRSIDINMIDYADQNSLSPRLSYLVELFARDDFLGLVHELRDLLAIQNQYEEWRNKLVFYSEMINEREHNRSLELDFVVQKNVNTKIQKMTQNRNALATHIALLQQDDDFLGLLDADNAKKLERILRAEKNIQVLKRASTEQNMQVMPSDELQSLAETLRKQKGFMIWRSQAIYEERLWRAKFELAQVNKTLLSLEQLQSSVQKIVKQGQDLQSYRDRISLANNKLLSQNIAVEQEIEFVQDKVRRKVLHTLQLHRVRLKHYLAQSRLSIARILDQASELPAPIEEEQTTDEELESSAQTPNMNSSPKPVEPNVENNDTTNATGDTKL